MSVIATRLEIIRKRTRQWVSGFFFVAASETSAIAALLIGGALARLIWTSNSLNITPVTTESHNIALSLARTGRFADPFANGGGFTAHLSMLTPLPSAAAYRLFGVDTPAAEFALSVWAVAIVSLGLWFAWKIFRLLGTPVWARIAAVAFIALVPLQFGLETREGRGWEVNLAVALMLWLLYRVIRADKEQKFNTYDLALSGALTGLTVIVSPPAGLASAAVVGLFVCLRLPPRRWWIAPLACLLVMGTLGGIWAERNLARLGSPVLLRDNFNLELDISNYSGAVDPADPKKAYLSRLYDIHPGTEGPGADKLRAAGGEISYYKNLGVEARNWITTHPRAFLRLGARRLLQFYLPPRWFWGTFGGGGKFVPLRQLLVWVTTILGFLAIVPMARRDRAYLYILVAILLCALPYTSVQPILRYRYLISSLLIFLAFDGIARICRHVVGARKLPLPGLVKSWS